MKSFFESRACLERKACGPCRSPNQVHRQIIAAHWDVPEVDFKCPYGMSSLDVRLSQQRKQESIPSWESLREQVASRWPNWLPEFDSSHYNLDGEKCKGCQDIARRRRWAERLVNLPS